MERIKSLDPTLSVHILALNQETTPSTFLSHFSANEVLIKGRPHGWVHQPHDIDRKRLLGHNWDLFLVTQVTELPAAALGLAKAHLSFQTAISVNEYETLIQHADSTPTASTATPPLPDKWTKGEIPSSAVVAGTNAALGPGELKLDESMANFLSSALPRNFVNAPVSLFNLFKYKDDDRSTHDAYMEDFKREYGNSAGASVKFMGVVDGPIRDQATDSAGGSGGGDTKRANVWDDANLVQYDTIGHYAYMLSTPQYQQMNRKKMAGLEDTCILCVSEVELSQ